MASLAGEFSLFYLIVPFHGPSAATLVCRPLASQLTNLREAGDSRQNTQDKTLWLERRFDQAVAEAQREYRNPSPIFVPIIAVEVLPVKGIYSF